MQTRIVSINVGDWSVDGSGIVRSLRIELSGSDVSNEALAAAYERATKAVGFPLSDLFQDYEESSMTSRQSRALIEAGINHVVFDDGPLNYIIDGQEVEDPEEDGYDGYDAVALAMAYIGYGIEGFTYKILPDEESIIGGYNAIVESYGYGLV